MKLINFIKFFIKDFFKIKNSFLLLASFLMTYILVISGFDWWYFKSMQIQELRQIFFPAIVLGGILPVVVPLFLFIYSKIFKNSFVLNYSYVLALSVLAGSLTSSILKAFTGRLEPNLLDLQNDLSGSFNFGFWEHGIFWGWPSSHTTIAFSMALVTGLYFNQTKKGRKYISLLCFLYALYIGVGISFSIHWFSDFVAGSILGTLVGLSVFAASKKSNLI